MQAKKRREKKKHFKIGENGVVFGIAQVVYSK